MPGRDGVWARGCRGVKGGEGSACGKPGPFPVFHRRRSLLFGYEQGVDVVEGLGVKRIGRGDSGLGAPLPHGISGEPDRVRVVYETVEDGVGEGAAGEEADDDVGVSRAHADGRLQL